MSIKHGVRVFCFFLLTWLLLPSALADIEVHFLDVGQGDSAVIICDGETMMIDGGQPDRSQFIFSYLKNTLGLDRIDYVIATHPDSDHIGGHSAALNACTAGVVYSPTTDNDTKTFQSLLKYTQKQGLDLIVPQAGDCFYLGIAEVSELTFDLMRFLIQRPDSGENFQVFHNRSFLRASACASGIIPAILPYVMTPSGKKASISSLHSIVPDLVHRSIFDIGECICWPPVEWKCSYSDVPAFHRYHSITIGIPASNRGPSSNPVSCSPGLQT